VLDCTAVALAEGEAAVLERLGCVVAGDGEAQFREVARDGAVLRGKASGRGRVALRSGAASQVLDLTAEPAAFTIPVAR